MKGLSESTLNKLWSDAVKVSGRCERCGNRDGLQAHHVIKRRYKTTKWNPLNGICLCPECHKWVHETIAGRSWELQQVDLEYLDSFGKNSKQYFIDRGISEDEFKRLMKDMCKAVVDGKK